MRLTHNLFFILYFICIEFLWLQFCSNVPLISSFYSICFAGIFCTNQLLSVRFHFFFTFTLQQLGYAILFKTHLSSTGAACGHMSCFWCVHKAMHVVRESHCAVCRQPYKHFPSICQLMHHLILKLEPADYKRREKEVLGEF